MKLISWTLGGPGAEATIADALRSAAPLVDMALWVWTGEPGTRPSADCLEVMSDDGLRRLELVGWPWRDDFGAARNAALGLAEARAADWSAMADSDEQVRCPDPAALRSWISSLDERVQVVLVESEDGSYNRERFFRHPVKHRFHGRTHEQFPVGHGEQALAPRELVTWWEQPKTAEQLRAKFERDASILAAERVTAPRDGRVLYYLGASLASLGRHEEAVDVFREAAEVGGHGAAWACYQAAVSYVELQRYDRAVDACLAGLARDASIAELAWYAGIASYYAGRPAQALAWARLAMAHPSSSPAARQRVGFKELKGLTWGPHDVAMHALRAMGDEHGAAEAEAARDALRGA